MTSYVAIRTDKQNRRFILDELAEGRLRQGWGYVARQDLRQIRAQRLAKEPLDPEQHEASRNRRMLEEAWDGLQTGDIALLPNLPEQGRWTLVRIIGPYDFAIPPRIRDYGHIRPVEPIRDPNGAIAVLHPSNVLVPAGLRRSMRCQSRIWSLDAFAEEIEAIIDAIKEGQDVSQPLAADERFTVLMAQMKEQAYALVDKAYGGAELEALIVRVLQSRYREAHAHAKIEHKGGAGEHGIDILVELPDPLGVDLKIGVQIKKHGGVEWSSKSLEQIRTAHEHWKIHAGVVITTAESFSEEYDAFRAELEDELGISIRVITRDELMEMILAHLAVHGGGSSGVLE